jgi:hypothetical protein
MPIEQWWPQLPAATQNWLVSNNGDAVPEHVIGEIERVGGPARSDAWWTGDPESGEVYLPDTAVDWIEAYANGEEQGAAEE